jgi:hypothetical protein
MASQPAIRSIPRAFLLAAPLAGFLAGSLPHSAAAEPAAVALSASGNDESAATPAPDQFPPPSARTNLLIAGAATTAVWYGLALGSAYAWPDTVGANDLRIPVAGPWQALSHSGCGNVANCSKAIVVLRAIATTLDAIGQASGLALVAEGLFLPTQEPKRQRAEWKPNRIELYPSLDAGKNSVGFGVLGVF